ncbi:MAG: type II toxin-antitoxin system RelE/ParE family toxin [Fidelibacterota bacterium]
MSQYGIEFKPAARRGMAKLPQDIQRRIGQQIDSLASNPLPPGVRKLTGSKNTYRVRVGDYRILYDLYQGRLVVLIVGVGHRRNVYR